jgi:hypothetical protein
VLKSSSKEYTMSAIQSDLSAPQYGYDLVCSTTQESINRTMAEYIASLQAPEFSVCYTMDENGNAVATTVAAIVASLGFDPFSIPDGSDQTDAQVQALYNLNFMFGFKAKMGAPAGAPAGSLPAIISLDRGSASSVTYQLYCAEFQVINLVLQFRNRYKFQNLVQPATAPWTFKMSVNLDLRTGDQDAFNNLPGPVQALVKNLNPDSLFSVQQLYLDLNTAAMETLPIIQGLDPSSQAAILLNQVFVATYWKNLGTSGFVLGYGVIPQTPSLAAPSIIPTDLNFQVSPNLDSSGNPTTNYDLYTLDYLVMSKGNPMPGTTSFTWNWVEPGEAATVDGTMAIRRDIFAAFLATLVSNQVQYLSVATNVSCTHDGEDFTTTMSTSYDPAYSTWQVTAPGTAAGGDGFTPLLTIAYNHPSYDSSVSASHLQSINGTFNYALTGDISVSGNVVRMTLHALSYMEFNWHLFGINAGNFNANVIDYLSVVEYTLGVSASGGLTAIESAPVNTDNSQDPDISGWDRFVGLQDVGNMFSDMKTALTGFIAQNIGGYEAAVQYMMNGSSGWVYPGGNTFAFQNVGFSDFQDLETHVTYINPNMLTERLAEIRAFAPRQAEVEAVDERLMLIAEPVA